MKRSIRVPNLAMDRREEGTMLSAVKTTLRVNAVAIHRSRVWLRNSARDITFDGTRTAKPTELFNIVLRPFASFPSEC